MTVRQLIGAVFVLLLSSLAFGQSVVRWDLGGPIAGVVTIATNPPTSTGVTPSYLVVLGNVKLNWCSFPANSTQGSACTNFATTFTDTSGSTPCPTSQQITLQGSNTCVATSDSLGNVGVNAAAGLYAYTLTSGSTVYGPFTVTLGGSAANLIGTANQITLTPNGTNTQIGFASPTVFPSSLSAPGPLSLTQGISAWEFTPDPNCPYLGVNSQDQFCDLQVNGLSYLVWNAMDNGNVNLLVPTFKFQIPNTNGQIYSFNSTDNLVELVPNTLITSAAVTSTVPGTFTKMNLSALSTQLIFNGNANTTSFSVGNPGTARAHTIPDPGANAKVGFTFNGTSGAYQTVRAVAGCTTAASIGGVCASAVACTWPQQWPDTNYSVQLTPTGPATNLPSNPYIVTKTNQSVTFNYYAITAAAASWPSVDCEGIHD